MLVSVRAHGREKYLACWLQLVSAIGRLVEELAPLLGDHVRRWEAEDLADLADLVVLVRAIEDGLASVHLHEDAPERPHVNLERIRVPEQHLWRAVEAALDVLVNLWCRGRR